VDSGPTGFFSDDEVEFGAAGFALLLVGLAASLSLGGYLATSDD
jgi:hypothetical protein